MVDSKTEPIESRTGWWTRLGTPSARITDRWQRERSGMLAVILVLFMAAIPVLFLLQQVAVMKNIGWGNPQTLIAVMVLLATVAAYVLNRRGFYLWATVLFIGSLLAGIVAATFVTLAGQMEPFFGRDDAHLLVYLVLPVMLAATLLPGRWWPLVLTAALASVLAVPLAFPHISWFSILYGPLLYLLAASGMLMLLGALMGSIWRSNYRRTAEREERLRALYEQSPDAIVLVAPDGTIESVNPAGRRLFGYELGEIEGRHVRTLYARPDDREAVIARAQSTGSLVDEPVRLQKKDGTVMDCRITIWRRSDGAGRHVGYQTIVRDVTERLRSEEEIELKGRLLDLANDAILLIDPGGEIVYANEAAALLTGYSPPELTTMNIRRLNTPEGAEQVPSRIGRMIREGGLDFEAMWVAMDGRRIDVEIRSRSVVSRGRPLFLSVARDVTRRHADEAELRLRGELLDAAHDAVLLHDTRGRLIFANESAARMLGYTRDQLLTMNACQLLTPGESSQFGRRVGELFARQAAIFESTYLTSDGRSLPVEVQSRLIESRGTACVLSIARDIRGRRQAEAALRESEAKYRALFEQSLDAISISRPDGSSLEANQAWLNLFGYAREDIPGIRASALYVNAADRERFLQQIAVTGFVTDEVRFRRKDGTEFDCGRTVMALKDASGSVVAFQSVNHDVTERKQAEVALRESETKYRALFEQSMDAIYIGTPDGVTVDVNQAWLDLFGYTRDELGDVTAIDLYADPADRVRFLETMAKHGVVADEVRYKRRDGTAFDVQRTVIARRDEQGRVIALQGVIRDITERKKAERLLRESEERFRSIMASMQDVVFTLDREQRHTGVYGPWVERAGLTAEFFLGRTADDIFGSEAAQVHREANTRALQGEFVVYDWSAPSADGTHYYQTSLSPIRDADGNVQGLVGIGRDITPHRKVQRELELSELRYRTLFERSLDAVCLVAADGTLLEANPAYLALFGYATEDVGRVNVREHYLNPAERDEYVSALERDGAVIDCRTRLLRTDGTVMDCIRSSVAHRDESGRIVTIQTVTRDVTEWVRAQDDLRRSEEKYRALFEQSMDAVAIYAVDGTLLDANPAHLALFGLSAADIGRRNVLSVYVNPADRDEFLRRLDRDGAVVDQEVRLRKVDGAEMDCVRTAVARRDAEGRLVAAQTVTRDITEKKRADSTLRESEQRYRMIADDTMDIIWRMDLDMRFTYVNPAVEKVFGFTPEEWAGTSLGDHCSPAEFSRIRAIAAERVQHYLATGQHGKGVLFEATMLDRLRVAIPVEVRAKLIVGVDGRPIALHGITRDIRERQAAELKIIQSREELRRLAEQLQELAAHLEEAREKERTGIARELHDQLGQALT
ncbi:MAG: PAS domain S-box protein, partial [Dehalococcoidia bacterium]|nr:PAS domain S-box protein [Dehalococcoidia bacterium]